MKIVYLDNAATTKMSDKVINEMTKSFSENYGNPSSVHALGQRAKSAVEKARHIVSQNLEVETTEIVFTSGGAEGNNLAIRGFLKANEDKGKHIVTSKIEHSTILKDFEQLEKEGYEVSYIGTDENGVVNIEELKQELREDTAIVSIMFVNNETGVIQPIKEIGEILAEKNIFFHTDAVQAMGKIKILPKDLKIGALTGTAHKFYGPKGAGFVFVDKKYSIEKEIWGGSQERNRRAGTENVHGILGLGVALEEVYENLKEIEEKEGKLQNYLETKLKSLYDIGKTDYNIDFENYKLLDFVENNESIDSILNSYMRDEVEELRVSLSMAEERKSYSNYDRYMPDLYLGYERVDRSLRGDRYYRDQDLFTIRFSKKLFSTDSEYKLNELEVENLKNESC